MSKRKTKERKIISDLHRKLQEQAQPVASSRHLHAQASIYSYKAQAQTTQKTAAISLDTVSHVRHDLLKTSLIIAGILVAQLVLFYLLKAHIIVIPMVRY